MKKPLQIPEAVDELIRHLPPELKKKVRTALDEIRSHPAHAGKPLCEDLDGFHSYVVGRFRVIYKINQAAISILTIGPRRTVYEKFSLELKRKFTA